ncbi:MAG TPA: VOC family protein [Bacteroidia bacterium]|jgi:predicted 3-demethylubiquinone-9 3-methyltransferase (glyoxalase superfamily)|nr:VOC family protein [Bacteroidia bacterium]
MKKITPFLWYDGKAQEAAEFYTSIFKNSKVVSSNPMSATFQIEGCEFIAFNGGPHFKFNESISLFIDCNTQEEVDELWSKLSKGGSESRCGWLKDKYGLSWQVVPSILGKLLGDKDPVKAKRVMDAMLKMSKINIKALQDAYEGK